MGVVLTVSLWLSAVALLRGVLLLAEGLLLARALLILSLLLTILGITYRHSCTFAINYMRWYFIAVMVGHTETN